MNGGQPRVQDYSHLLLVALESDKPVLRYIHQNQNGNPKSLRFTGIQLVARSMRGGVCDTNTVLLALQMKIN